MPEFPRGRFVWYDLMTPDPDAAMTFYTEVFGWGTTPFEGSEAPYTMFTVGDTPIGGVMQLPPDAQAAGAPPHWISYVGTADVAASVARAQELGASVMVPPQDIPNVGTFAVLGDPQGAVFAVFRSQSEEQGSDAPAEVGQMSWHELLADDYKAAFDFYHQLFGWQKGEAMDMGEAGIYQLFGFGEMPAGGMMNRPEGMPVSAWLYYTRVENIGATIEKGRQHGGQVVHGPMDVPGGDQVAQCVDPQGGMFAVHQVGGGSMP